jgi:membrane protease YdiL (CAAX protease family)
MPPSDPDYPPPPDPPEPEWTDDPPIVYPVPAVTCWRCGRLEVPVAGRCPACRARIAADETRQSDSERASGATHTPALTPLLVMFGLFLLSSVIWGWILLANGAKMTADEVREGTAVLEVIDTMLVLVALALIGFVSLPDPPEGARAIAWAVAAPALFILICGNVLYFAFLREIIRPNVFLPAAPELTLITVLMACVQPAIIEEVFFRYLALGVLQQATGMTRAIWVSAVMFAVAHIYNPLGMPYILVAGVFLGYARVYGGLLLPMILHFLHNLAVVVIEVAK